MKNLISIFVLFLSTLIVINAQGIGLKAGISHSNVYDSEGETFTADPKYGFNGGIFIKIPLGGFLGIQPEALITQKGFKGTGTLLGTSYDLTRTTTFFEVPLMLAIKPAPFVSLLAGPQFSYLLKQRDVFSNSVASIIQEEEFKQDNIRKNILGFIGGVDVQLSHLVLSGRIGWDFQTNKGDGTSSTPRYKNVSSQFTIGYLFY